MTETKDDTDPRKQKDAEAAESPGREDEAPAQPAAKVPPEPGQGGSAPLKVNWVRGGIPLAIGLHFLVPSSPAQQPQRDA